MDKAILQKVWYVSTRRHGVTFQNTTMLLKGDILETGVRTEKIVSLRIISAEHRVQWLALILAMLVLPVLLLVTHTAA
jgi:hypothetical protein